jgi:hypothetical protein
MKRILFLFLLLVLSCRSNTQSENELASIICDNERLILSVGESRAINAYGQSRSGDSIACTIKMLSSDTTLATVQNQQVSANRAGFCWLILSCDDISGSISIYITEKPIQNIAIVPSSIYVLVDDSVDVDLIIYNCIGERIDFPKIPAKWRVANPAKATVRNGLIYGLSEGTSILIAELDDFCDSSRVEVVALPSPP